MTEVEVYDAQRAAGPVPVRRDWLELLEPAAKLAEVVATTDFVPSALRGKPAAITAAILYGDEVGLSPMQSLAKVHVIEGRPALAAEAMRALVLAQGHRLWLETFTTIEVTWCGHPRDDADHVTRITWTMDDARKAGLDGRQNWKRYPRAMLSARATADLCRAVFPHVIGGLMAIEELDDGVVDVGDDDAPDVGAPTPKKTTAKRTRKKATPAPRAPAPAAGDLPALPTAPPTPRPAAASSGPSTGPAQDPAAGPDLPDDGDPGAEEPPPVGGSLPWPNYYAMKTKKVGLDDEHRHGLTRAITDGRTDSSKNMTDAEQQLAREVLEGLDPDRKTRRLIHEGLEWRVEAKKEGEVVVVASGSDPSSEAPDAEVSDIGSPEGPNPPAESGDEEATGPPTSGPVSIGDVAGVDEAALKRLARSKGMKLPDVIGKAGEGYSSAMAPKSYSDVVASPELVAKVVEWLNALPDA